MAPGAVEAVGIVGQVGGGAEPHGIVKVSGGLAVGDARVTHAVGEISPHHHPANGAEAAGLDIGHDLLPHLAAALLLAHLHNALVAAGGRDHGFGFADGVSHRLFDIHSFSRFAGQDSCQAMPVVGGADHNGVEIGVFEHFAKIAIEPGFCAKIPLYVGGAFVQYFFIHIAKPAADNAFLFETIDEVAETHVPAADEPHTNLIGGPRPVAFCQ